MEVGCGSGAEGVMPGLGGPGPQPWDHGTFRQLSTSTGSHILSEDRSANRQRRWRLRDTREDPDSSLLLPLWAQLHVVPQGQPATAPRGQSCRGPCAPKLLLCLWSRSKYLYPVVMGQGQA
jgi:hypothetical protein